jgi:hypothetical protein
MPEDFDIKKIVSLCASKFNSKCRLIPIIVEGKNHILLTPNIFIRIIRLPTSNKFLWISEVDSFLDSRGGVVNLLKDFLASPAKMSIDTTQVDINLLS